MSTQTMSVSRRRIIGAGAWTLGGYLTAQAVRFVGNVVLARLLFPDVFGTVAVATAILVGLAMFTDLGLQQGVVRSANSERPGYLDTVWIIQILQSSFISLCLLAVAGLVAVLQARSLLPEGTAYAHPQFPLALAGLSASCFIEGLASSNWAGATRRLEAARQVVIEVGCQLTSLVTMLLWARVDPSVRALVAGAVVNSLCRAAASHILITGPRNRFRFSREAATEIFGFGRWLFLSSALAFLASNVDKVLLAWLVSAEELGIYSIAMTMIMVVHNVVNRLATRVGYPALSAIHRSDPNQLVRTYYRARLAADAFCLPCAGILTVCAGDIVALLYPGRYAEAGAYLAILGFSFIGVRFVLLTQIYLVLGNSRLIIYEQVVKLVFSWIGIWYGSRYFGMTGAVWCIAFSYVAAGFASALLVARPLGLWRTSRELLALPLFGVGVLAGLALEQVLRHLATVRLCLHHCL